MKRKLYLFSAILLMSLASISHFSLFSANPSSTEPVVVTTPATSITMNSAMLNGTVHANNNSTAMTFEYGITPAYGTVIFATPSPVIGNTVTSVSGYITGLVPCVVYHYRCVGIYSGGTVYGSDLTFSTCLPPSVSTSAPTNVTQTSVTLNGIVSANNNPTTVAFSLGMAGSLDVSIPAVPSIVTGTAPTPVSATVTGLLPCTVYHYYCIGQNSSGSANGSDLTFTTGSAPAGAAGPITGPTQVCACGTGYVYSVSIPNATGYVWTLPVSGTITSGINTNSITVSFACNALPGYIFVYGTSPCGYGTPSQLYVGMNPQETPTITGPASSCLSSCGNVYSTQTGKTNYIWTISPGGLITAGGTSTSPTATVCWNTAGNQTVSVNYSSTNSCPANSPAVFQTTVNPLPAPIITGTTTACTNFTDYVYSTDSGMTGYVWAVSSGGTITSGSLTNTIHVVWATTGAKTVCVNYTNPNGCSAAVTACLPVNISAGPTPTITGMTNVCVNSGYLTYTTQAGMTGYTWSLSPGGVISYGAGTNSIQVTWASPGSQWVMVSYTNANGCSPSVPGELDVTVNSLPGPAATITGPDHVCAGASGIVYSTTPITNATAYVWSLPAGAVMTAGAGTNSITVNFASEAQSGDIQVYGNNVCGNGMASVLFHVTVDPLPSPAGTITGPYNVSILSTGIIYSVPEIPGATGYVWNMPPGIIIVSGANTNSISVDFTAAAVSGVISVYGTNSCGDGPVSPDFNVTVNPIPDAPMIMLNGYMLRSNYSAGNQWYRDGEAIPGATEQDYDASTNHTGFYWDVVSVNGYSSDTSNHIYLVLVGMNDQTKSRFDISPVPNDGRFAIDIVTSSQETFSVSVFNVPGVKIYEAQNIIVNGTLREIIDIRPAAEGIYTVVLDNGKTRFEKKIVLNK